MLIVTVTNESYPPGKEFSIANLGLFVNGEATQIDEAQEIDYYNVFGVRVQDIDDPNVKVEGSPLASFPAPETEAAPVEVPTPVVPLVTEDTHEEEGA